VSGQLILFDVWKKPVAINCGRLGFLLNSWMTNRKALAARLCRTKT